MESAGWAAHLYSTKRPVDGKEGGTKSLYDILCYLYSANAIAIYSEMKLGQPMCCGWEALLPNCHSQHMNIFVVLTFTRLHFLPYSNAIRNCVGQ